MINTSSTYKQILASENCKWAYSATVTFSDKSTLILDNSRLAENGVSISDGTSNQDEFSVGSFVSKTLMLKIQNFDGVISESKFSGAKIAVKIGLVIATNSETGVKTYEWINWGDFYVDKHSTQNGTIVITAYDAAVRFESKYDSTLSYPATLYDILNDACNKCGVTLYTTSFTNSTYSVTERPSDDATTYADIVSYVAQLAGCWARISNLGKLVLGWYDMDRAYQDTGNVLSGGTFTGSQTDVLSGGTFASVPENLLCGGVFRSGLYAPEISSLSSCSIQTKDVVITGIQLIPYNTDLATTFLGDAGYVISIEQNPLAQNNLDSLVNTLADKFIGFHFRPMNVSALNDPSIEAGDVAWVVDTRGNQYPTIISNIDYSAYDYEKFSADAESESDNSSTHYGIAAKAVQAAKSETTRQISTYDQATNTFASMAALTMGLYPTRQQQDDGSYILYWHDKPNLADSQTIWKLNQNTLSVSDDGGTTWRGMDSSGNILAKVLTVIGINADWINAGNISADLINAGDLKISDSITIQDGNGKTIITSHGVKLVFVFESSGDLSGFQQIGWKDYGGTVGKVALFSYVFIPSEITITKATLTADIMSKYFITGAGSSVPTGYYTASNIKAYFGKNFSQMYLNYPYAAEPYISSEALTQMSAFGIFAPSASAAIQSKAVDVTECVAAGQKTLFSLTAGADTYSSGKEITDSAYAKITIVVEGFVAG